MRKIVLTAALAALLVAPARAEFGFPADVAFPPQIVVDPDQKLVEEAVGEAEIPADSAGTATTRKGRHLTRWLRWKPAAGEPAPGFYNGTEERIAAAMTGKLTAAGWSLAYQSENKAEFAMQRRRDGREVWLWVKMDAPQAQVRVEIVEVGAAMRRLVLPKPAVKPEAISDKADFPYLPPFPGSKFTGGGRGDGPLDVAEPGKGGEPRLAGHGVVTRSYQGPADLSAREFVEATRAALLEAGWTLLYPTGDAEGYGGLAAHYAKDGRDIWIRATYEYGAQLGYSVADAGRDDLAARLAKECHVALTGVFFDFNKASLQPDSQPALTRAAAAIKAAAKTRFEIQGHTDAVGGDAYNQKLSEERAGAVRDWLAKAGVEAGRLTAKGYGRTQPVADNATDAGRARNRRVELATPDCRK